MLLRLVILNLGGKSKCGKSKENLEGEYGKVNEC